MLFQRIACTSKGKIKIQYTNSTGEKCSIESADQARPEFYTALKAFVADVLDICEAPINWSVDVAIVAVGFATANDKTAVAIRATRMLKDGKTRWLFETPARLLDKLSEATQKRVAVLESEATMYIRGKRAQERLALDDQPPTNVNMATGEITDSEIVRASMAAKYPAVAEAVAKEADQEPAAQRGDLGPQSQQAISTPTRALKQ